MRVIQATSFGGPEVLVAKDQQDPVAGPGQVEVAVSAAEMLFLDVQLRSGWGREFFPIEPPYVPGTGVAGTVRAVGEDVDPDWVGKRVVAATGKSGEYVGGGYAERAVAPVTEVFEVPDTLELPAALTALHDGLTALSRLERAAIEPGERVLVTAAAGSLGVWLIPLARAAGADVVAAARGGQKLAHATALGADGTVDYSADDWTERLQAAYGGARPDVVFDGAGGQIGRAAFEVTAPGGRFFSYGAASGDFAAIDTDERPAGDVTVYGIQDRIAPADWARLTKQALAELATGRVTPVIGQTFPLARAAAADTTAEAHTAIGKTVLLT
ncbi:MAG: zinc-binding dehydrogenase [Streptosporangiales bacterium]|nr:zinc-binding dehydrogenase [Streptosporangiales bacterium]